MLPDFTASGGDTMNYWFVLDAIPELNFPEGGPPFFFGRKKYFYGGEFFLQRLRNRIKWLIITS